jgi:hypothetical protein
VGKTASDSSLIVAVITGRAPEFATASHLERKVRALFRTYLPFVDGTMLASIIADPIEYRVRARRHINVH